MTFYHFGDMSQAFHDVFIHAALLEVDAYVCAGAVTQALGVDIETTAGDDVGLDEVLYTLVDGGTRDITLCGYILKWDTCIL
jgi:hypothetical protein